MKEAGKKLKKILGILGIASLLFFVVTFIVYFFNLDMKAAAAALEPYMEKWHDRVPRERKL